eukprot:5503735-Amphidinium_carterae.1
MDAMGHFERQDCPKCGTMNFANRQECFKCNAPKENGRGGGGGRRRRSPSQLPSSFTTRLHPPKGSVPQRVFKKLPPQLCSLFGVGLVV